MQKGYTNSKKASNYSIPHTKQQINYYNTVYNEVNP